MRRICAREPNQLERKERGSASVGQDPYTLKPTEARTAFPHRQRFPHGHSPERKPAALKHDNFLHLQPRSPKPDFHASLNQNAAVLIRSSNSDALLFHTLSIRMQLSTWSLKLRDRTFQIPLNQNATVYIEPRARLETKKCTLPDIHRLLSGHNLKTPPKHSAFWTLFWTSNGVFF